jgi:type IV pilus assembly protein PilV
MIEVLITLVVTSAGLVGMAALQGRGVAQNHNASLRTQSAVLAYDMVDRMRANAAAAGTVKAGNYLLAATDNSCKAVHPEHQHVAVTACTPSQLAQDDLYEWQRELALRLPGGTGVVCIDSTPYDGSPATPACDGIGNVYAVKVWWGERTRSAADLSSPSSYRRFVLLYRP